MKQCNAFCWKVSDAMDRPNNVKITLSSMDKGCVRRAFLSSMGFEGGFVGFNVNPEFNGVCMGFIN